MKNHFRIKALLDGYLAGTLSDTELKEFLLQIKQEDDFLKSVIDEWLHKESFAGLADTEKGEMIFKQIVEKKNSLAKEEAKVITISKYRWKRLFVAASIFALLLCGVWFIFNQHQGRGSQVAQAVVGSPVQVITNCVGCKAKPFCHFIAA